MQNIYNYTPETNHVSRVYSAAAVLYLQFVLYVMLFCQQRSLSIGSSYSSPITVLAIQWIASNLWNFYCFHRILKTE